VLLTSRTETIAGLDLLWRPGLASQRRDHVGQPKVKV